MTESEKEIKHFGKFILSAIFTAPFYIAMVGPMMSLPVPNIISPQTNPLNFGLVQLILSNPVHHCRV